MPSTERRLPQVATGQRPPPRPWMGLGLSLLVSLAGGLATIAIGWAAEAPPVTSPEASAPDVAPTPPALAPPPPRAWHVEVSIRYWAPSLHGRFFSAEGGNAGTTARFATDLGLPEHKSFWYPIVTAHLGERHRLTFSYLSLRYTADTAVNRALNLQGQSFTVGAPLHSEAKIKDLSVAYDYLAWKREKWTGFVGGQLHYFDAAVTLNSTGVNVSEKAKIPIPTIGGGGEYQLRDWAIVKGDYHVFAIPVGDLRGSLQDGQIGVTVEKELPPDPMAEPPPAPPVPPSAR